MSPADPCPYVTRGGIKLAAALDAFGFDPTGWICADLGANVGGFTDCLLQRGAARVFAVDTAYGQLAWKLRQNPHVVVLERANALHLDPLSIESFAPCRLVVMDLGWTRQRLAIPAALRWLEEGPSARIITLIKPHYELAEKGNTILSEALAENTCQDVLAAMPSLGVRVLGCIRSPILGGGGRKKAGNIEYLALLERLSFREQESTDS